MAREHAGFTTGAEAARALGVATPTYYAHENGSSGIRPAVARKYARKFGVRTDWLLYGEGPMSTDGTTVSDVPIAGLPLLGIIQAGHWLEISFADEGAEVEMVQVASDPRYPQAKQYALKVVGDSVDQEYPDGSIVTCVNFADSGLSLTEGMMLHVERHRGGGQLVEATLKVLERRNGQLYLAPRSSNPKYVAFPVDGSPDTEVIVRGVVTGGWAPRRLP
jgi:SOS-response transcriptional repressor LexA